MQGEGLLGAFGVPFSLLWSLKYRPPKHISPAKYARIGVGFSDQCGGNCESKTWLGQIIIGQVHALESSAIEMERKAEALDRQASEIEGSLE